MLPSSITRGLRLDKPPQLARRGRPPCETRLPRPLPTRRARPPGKPPEAVTRETAFHPILTRPGWANSVHWTRWGSLCAMHSDREGRGCGFVLLMGFLATFGTAVALYAVVFVLEQGFGVGVSLDGAFGIVVWPSLAAGPAVVAWLLSRPEPPVLPRGGGRG